MILTALALVVARYQNANGESPDMLVIPTSREDELKAEFDKQAHYPADEIVPAEALCLIAGIPVHKSPFLAPDQVVAIGGDGFSDGWLEQYHERERRDRQVQWFDSFIDAWRKC